MSKYNGLTPSQHEANKRYIAKTYKTFHFFLRIDDDKEIIDSIQEAKDQGMNKTEWLRELFELANRK